MAKKKKKRRADSAIKSIIIVAIMACLIVIAFYRVTNNKKTEALVEEETHISAVNEILLRNLDQNYPPSPKEVVKYYSELTKCLYNEDCSDEEIEALANKALLLYDDELANNQQWDRYLTDLKSEIATRRSQDYAIMSYSLSASTDVTYFEKDNYECASLYCTLKIRNGANPGTVEELFVLRKDDKGHWRIFGWDLTQDNVDSAQENSGNE